MHQQYPSNHPQLPPPGLHIASVTHLFPTNQKITQTAKMRASSSDLEMNDNQRPTAQGIDERGAFTVKYRATNICEIIDFYLLRRECVDTQLVIDRPSAHQQYAIRTPKCMYLEANMTSKAIRWPNCKIYEIIIHTFKPLIQEKISKDTQKQPYSMLKIEEYSHQHDFLSNKTMQTEKPITVKLCPYENLQIKFHICNHYTQSRYYLII